MKRVLKVSKTVVGVIVGVAGVAVLAFAALCTYLELSEYNEQCRNFYENQ